MLKEIRAHPETWGNLLLHLATVPLVTVQFSLMPMMALIMLRAFEAGERGSLAATMAVPVMHVFTILWSEAYRRLSSGTYLFVVWSIGMIPLSLLAMTSEAAVAIPLVLVAAIGFSGMHPLHGDLMRTFYPAGERGSVQACLNVIGQSCTIAFTLGIGFWLASDPHAFRIYIPLSLVPVAAGYLILYRLTRKPRFLARHHDQETGSWLGSLRRAVTGMTRVLKEDRRFRQYELAFFIYGMGWMACTALLPFICDHRLHLEYDDVAKSTQFALYVPMLLLTVPMGRLMDRWGPIRMASLCFLLLGLYPLGLMLARNATDLQWITLLYGVAMTGVVLAWNVGPINLAPDPSRASHYLAIHATMVGIRAIPGQLMAVQLYLWTDSLEVPLVLSVAAFLTGGVIMLQLVRKERIRDAVSAPAAEEAALPVSLVGSSLPCPEMSAIDVEGGIPDDEIPTEQQ